MKYFGPHHPTYLMKDRMPFGRYTGTPLRRVPAAYLACLWVQRPLDDKKLENHIANRREAIEQAIGDAI